MASYGFNFRATSGGISPLADGAGETYVLGSDTSPTTRNGITFKWSSSLDGRDRLTTGDARLAGINFQGNTSSEVYFSVTLPSTGEVTIRAAFGDGTAAQTQFVRFKEGTTTFATIAGVESGGNAFVDASGTLRASQASWTSSNASITHTFTTTDFRVYIADPALAGGNSTTIAHLFIDIAGGGSSTTPQRRTSNSLGTRAGSRSL